MEQPQYTASLIKLLPATAVVTVLSQLSLSTYYDYFNFNPLSYLEPYEIIASSVKQFILFGFTLLLFSQVILVWVFPYLDRQSRFNDYLNRHKVIKKKPLDTLFNYIAYAFLPISSWLISTVLLGSNQLTIWFWVGFILLFFYNNSYNRFNYMKYSNKSYYSKYKPYHINIDPYIVLFSFFLLICVNLTSLIAAKNMMEYDYLKGSYIVLNDNFEKIAVTSKVKFIGQSNKYVFIFNTPDSSIRIISRDQIHKMIIKHTPKHISPKYYNPLEVKW